MFRLFFFFRADFAIEGRELVVANTIQTDTMYQLLIQKEYFTEAEFLAKMKDVQMDYQKGSKV